jgi:uncharacterized delta-60 repeat protein
MSSARASWLIAVVHALGAAPAADAANLRLDHRFGEGGIARVRFEAAQGGAPDSKALRPVRQPDGKVLVTAAWHGDHGEAHFLIARFTRSGRPDASFGHGGRERLGVRWNFDPYAVHVRPDGRILVLGAAGYGAGWNFQGQIGLIRLLPDGTRDRGFGTNGLVAWNPPWRAGTVNLVALPGVFVPQADGAVLAVGFVQERINLALPGPYPEARRVVSVRFDQRGSVDESFGRGGMIEGPDGADIPVYWAAFPDGHLAGLDVRPEGGGVMTGSLQRFNPDGTLDQGFGQDGSVQLGSNLPAGVSELMPARDGSLVIVGSDPAGRATSRGSRRGRPGSKDVVRR